MPESVALRSTLENSALVALSGRATLVRISEQNFFLRSGVRFERQRRYARGNCEVERAAFRFRGPNGEERTGAVVDIHLSRQEL